MILGKQVRLRAIEKEDLPRFVVWLNDPQVRRNLLLYGLGGVVTPFIGIWLIDLLVRLLPDVWRARVETFMALVVLLFLALLIEPAEEALGGLPATKRHAAHLAAETLAAALADPGRDG